MAIYEEVLGAGSARADVLATISGDLGSTGHVAQVIELIAPRYDVERHGPATGINLLQAYLAMREAGPAQHVLDLLFSLNRPDLEDRLHGFSNAVAEAMLAEASGVIPAGEGAPRPDPAATRDTPEIALASISRPLWIYGLESLAARIVPPKEGRLRRVAFAQLCLPRAYPDFDAAMKLPEDELGRLARAVPAWLAETFYFSPAYASSVALGILHDLDGSRHPALFGAEWTTETVRQLVDSTPEGLDYVFTGALSHRAGDFELVLRVWEVKKYRERKQFTARWAPASADSELTQLREAVCRFMEWTPYPPGSGSVYAAPAGPRAWLDVISASLNLFLAEKGMLAKEQFPPLEPLAAECARLAPDSEVASLAWVTLARRCRARGLPPPAQPRRLFDSDLVREAEGLA